jgi:hypothetical protein
MKSADSRENRPSAADAALILRNYGTAEAVPLQTIAFSASSEVFSACSEARCFYP